MKVKISLPVEVEIDSEAFEKAIDKSIMNNPDIALVVRCKECKFYEVAEYDNGTKDVCRLLTRQMQENDFCSYGERKEK